MAYTEKNGLQVEVNWIHDDEDLLIFVHQTGRLSQFTSSVVLYPAVVAEEGDDAAAAHQPDDPFAFNVKKEAQNWGIFVQLKDDFAGEKGARKVEQTFIVHDDLEVAQLLCSRHLYTETVSWS
ncbi:hypothetical protein TYRP_000658 [Tyrophagus putrescentiae]|nr:hypothetical protein TYRP_000658 [Tyrophagus putrescentiae]